MKIQLIKLKDKFILVSDERVSSIQPEYYYCNKDHDWYKFSEDMMDDLKKEDRPILAGIEELPIVDLSDLKEEDCKRIGWVDVDKLAEIAFENRLTETNQDISWVGYGKGVDGIEKSKWINLWIKGFKTAQSLNDKSFSLEDMRKSMELGLTLIPDNDYNDANFAKFIQSLQQTVWDVEVENNSIKIIKIL